MMQIFKSMFSTRQFEICTHPLAVDVDEGCNDRMLWKEITSVHVRIVNKPFIHNYTSAQYNMIYYPPWCQYLHAV